MRLATLVLWLALAAAQAAAQDFREVVRRVDDAVGRVLAEGRSSLSTGSGFVVGSDGDALIFVTNNHVIRGADRLVVGFANGDGIALYAGEVVAASPRRDLAVLRLARNGGAPHRPSPLQVAGRDPDKAEPVAAFGFPGVSDDLIGGIRDPAFFDTTVTEGSVSKVFLGNWRDRDPVFGVVQHSAAINSGNSGGPLIDRCGNVVGVNTGRPLDRPSAEGTQWASSALALTEWLDTIGVAHDSASGDCGGSGARLTAQEAASDAGSGRIWLIAGGGAATLAIAGAGFVGWRRHRGAAPAATPEPVAAAAQPADARPAIELVVTGDGKDRARHRLTKSQIRRGVIIGRGADATVALSGNGLSRRHARIALENGAITITDLGSTNGTLLDGRPLTPHAAVPLKASSRVEIAGNLLKLRRPEG